MEAAGSSEMLVLLYCIKLQGITFQMTVTSYLPPREPQILHKNARLQCILSRLPDDPDQGAAVLFESPDTENEYPCHSPSYKN
jgi:hypothetical protein